MPRAQLSAVTLPEFGTPTVEPQLTRDIYRARIARLESRMAEAGLDAIVIYGDREHLANISWASGYDPRFEEALLIVVPGRTPCLLAGNEGYPYAETAAGDFDRVLWQPLSLMGQPRDRSGLCAMSCAMRASDMTCASALRAGRASRRKMAPSIRTGSRRRTISSRR